MSHDLEFSNGAANMVWTNQVPWHGLGTEMDPKHGAIEWMKAANLDWTVHKQPMFTTLPNGENVAVKGRGGNEYSVLVRDRGNNTYEEKDIFGPVGPGWTAVQNEQVFTFMERFCKAGKMKMETCGSLKGGTEIWALAKYRDDFELVKGDTMKGYLLFHSAHVWGKGNSLRNTLTRVVCNNTLTMALRSGVSKGAAFRMPHVSEFDASVQSRAEQAVGLAEAQTEEFREAAEFLTKKKADPAHVAEFITRLYQPKEMKRREAENDNTPYKDTFTQTSEMVWNAAHLAPGSELASSKGTWWGAFNGVTYHEDHLRISYQEPTNVLGTAWFGSGAALKEKAMVLAQEYAKVA